MSICKPNTIITGHSDADYDALAAMVAAKKLYPDATLIAPTMIARQDNHSFTDNISKRFNMLQPKDCDMSQVTKLVIVDTCTPSRLKHVKAVLDSPDREIHIFDHHPKTDDDLKADFIIRKDWGSSTAIIVSILKEKEISLNADEATMLALGIFEDTGSFTFSSTTEHDFEAAAYLARYKIDFDTIAELMKGELTSQQVHILDELLSSAETHNVHGIPVTIVEISLDSFLGDFASIVSKLMDMEKLKVVFALASMGHRIHMIARSNIPELDVGQICSSFGGGGHAAAAASSIKDKTLAQTKAELLTLLYTSTNPEISVGTHMTSPARTISTEMPIVEAEEIMNRFGLKAAPIVDEESGQCVGILDLETASRAKGHKLGDLAVKEYMIRNITTLSPDSDLHLAIGIILQQRQRLIPIIDEDEVVGVLTRTDILRIMVDESLRLPRNLVESQEGTKNLSETMKGSLPVDVMKILRDAGLLADKMGYQVFAVGGFVRDLIMKEHNLDLDLSVEGDGLEYANALAKLLGGHVRRHHKFKTAIVFYTDSKGEEAHIDVATARMEYYERPAALPSVELASIHMDLFRRDFTINAMAIQLNEKSFGVVIDPFGGQKDIKQQNISILHSLSLVEDPTRILRAVRFEQRYGFKINGQTERLIRNSIRLDMISRLSGPRLFNEMMHVFDEQKANECLERLNSWGIWKSIHPQFALTPTKREIMHNFEEILGWYKLLYREKKPQRWVLYMLVMCSNIKYTHVKDILDRLGFVPRVKKDFLRLRGSVHRTSRALVRQHRDGRLNLSDLYELLSPVALEGLLFIMARYGQKNDIGSDISFYLTKLKNVHVDVTGDDLMELGYPEAPVLGKMLHALLLAKLNGKASDREDQLKLAENYLHKAKADSFEQPSLESILECKKI